VTVVSAIVKVKRELKVAPAECAMCEASVPVPLILKLLVCADELCTVTVNGAPATVGVTELGETVHVGGAPVPQVRFTALAYPFRAVRLPFNVADVLTVADAGELMIAME
jgi:hypothetical protein